MAKRTPDGELDSDDAPGDPLEEVGPEECAPTPIEAGFQAGSIEESPMADRPKFSEEIHESYQPETDVLVPHPVDGMPIPRAELADNPVAYAPAFTHDNLVCIGDDRTWVALFENEDAAMEAASTIAHFATSLGMGKAGSLVEPSVKLFAYTPGGDANERLSFPKDRVVNRWGVNLVLLTAEEAVALEGKAHGVHEGAMLPVRPLRPQCGYYKRQVFSNDAQPDPLSPMHKIVFRNCTMRRSVGGAFMSLRDEAVYACDYRHPPDPGSVKLHLDEPDAKRLASRDHETLVQLFKNKA